VDFAVGTTADVHILLNGVSLFAGTIDGFAGRPYIARPRFGSSPDQSYAALLTLSAGDVLDFAVADRGNGRFFAGTEVSASLTAATPLSVTTNSNIMLAGNNPPPLTGSVNGTPFTSPFQYTTPLGDTITITLSTTATSTSPVGQCPITATLSG